MLAFVHVAINRNMVNMTNTNVILTIYDIMILPNTNREIMSDKRQY